MTPSRSSRAYKDFDIRIVRQAWGIKLEIKNAPATAFVDGEMIKGIKEHLFAVLRDIVYTSNEIVDSQALRSRRPDSHHERGVPHPAQRPRPRDQGPTESRRLLGRPFDRRARSTTTRSRSATSSACAASMSAPAAARAP